MRSRFSSACCEFQWQRARVGFAVVGFGLAMEQAWMAVAAVLSCFGVIHAYRLDTQGIENHLGWWAAADFTLGYLAAALFLLACHWYAQNRTGAFADEALATDHWSGV